MRSFFFSVLSIIVLSSAFHAANAEKYFAQVENGTVKNVIVADLGFVVKLPGTWIETFKGVPGKTYAGIGYHYNTTSKDFEVEPIPAYVKLINSQMKVAYDALKLSWALSPNGTVSVK